VFCQDPHSKHAEEACVTHLQVKIFRLRPSSFLHQLTATSQTPFYNERASEPSSYIILSRSACVRDMRGVQYGNQFPRRSPCETPFCVHCPIRLAQAVVPQADSPQVPRSRILRSPTSSLARDNATHRAGHRQRSPHSVASRPLPDICSVWCNVGFHCQVRAGQYLLSDNDLAASGLKSLAEADGRWLACAGERPRVGVKNHSGGSGRCSAHQRGRTLLLQTGSWFAARHIITTQPHPMPPQHAMA